MLDTIKLVSHVSKPLKMGDLPAFLSDDLEKCARRKIINPTRKMLEQMPYLPRITYLEHPMVGGRIHRFSLELSLPKLLFGNNFSELKNEDLSEVISKIKQALRVMGVDRFFTQPIESLEVSKIDFSKNIVLDNNTTASEIIGIINTADISRVFDTQCDCFRNGGQALHIHTNSQDIVVYDKIADLRQSKISEKRAMEKDNLVQRALLGKLGQQPSLSVTRFEVRFNGKRKIEAELRRLGINTPLTLGGLFSSEIARQVLTDKWQKIYADIPKCELDTSDPLQLLANILRERKTRPTTALARLGWALLADRVKDMRNVRNLIDDAYGRHTWPRIKGIREPPEKAQLKTLLQVNETIIGMTPIRLEDYV